MVTKMGLSEASLWRARAGQARRVVGMLSPRDAALVEAYANAKTVPVQPRSKALGSIPLYQSKSSVETTRDLDRQAEVVCQTKPHRLAALAED